MWVTEEQLSISRIPQAAPACVTGKVHSDLPAPCQPANLKVNAKVGVKGKLVKLGGKVQGTCTENE